MDAVVRRQTLTMMINTAKATDNTQFSQFTHPHLGPPCLLPSDRLTDCPRYTSLCFTVLISPQDMSGVITGPSVKIIQMVRLGSLVSSLPLLSPEAEADLPSASSGSPPTARPKEVQQARRRLETEVQVVPASSALALLLVPDDRPFTFNLRSPPDYLVIAVFSSTPSFASFSLSLSSRSRQVFALHLFFKRPFTTPHTLMLNLRTLTPLPQSMACSVNSYSASPLFPLPELNEHKNRIET